MTSDDSPDDSPDNAAHPWMATFIACAALDGHFNCMRGPPDMQAMAALADDL
jgi:hypothetical protein